MTRLESMEAQAQITRDLQPKTGDKVELFEGQMVKYDGRSDIVAVGAGYGAVAQYTEGEPVAVVTFPEFENLTQYVPVEHLEPVIKDEPEPWPVNEDEALTVGAYVLRLVADEDDPLNDYSPDYLVRVAQVLEATIR